MTSTDLVAAARDQLNRTLTFFPRVDAKASVVLAVNTSMLAVLATRAVPYTQLTWEWIPIGVAALLLGLSFWHIYKEAFPSLEGGHDSLLYFREVAKRTETKYLEAWTGVTESQYLNDLLAQVWRNSEILTKKFDHMRWAFNFLALAIVPWIVSIALLTWRASQVTTP